MSEPKDEEFLKRVPASMVSQAFMTAIVRLTEVLQDPDQGATGKAEAARALAEVATVAKVNGYLDWD